MCIDPQEKSRGDPSTPFFPPIPLEIGPLNLARRSGERCKLLSRVWGRAAAKIEFDAFYP